MRLQRTRGSRDVALWGPGGGSWWEKEEKYKEDRVERWGRGTVRTGDTGREGAGEG